MCKSGKPIYLFRKVINVQHSNHGAQDTEVYWYKLPLRFSKYFSPR